MFHRIFKFLTVRPFAFSAMVFGFILVISALFISHELERNKQEVKYQAFVNLLTLGARLEGEINAHLVVLRGLRAEIAINTDITQYEFEQLVTEYLRTQLSIRHIALAPNLIISSIHPLQGNEAALGLDYRSVPEQFSSVMKSVELNEILLSGPVNLVQGGTGLIARVPVFLGHSQDNLWGIIAAVIDDVDLLQRAGVDSHLWGLDIAIRGKDGQGAEGDVFYGSPEVFNDEAVSVDVILPAGRWQLAANARNGWRATPRQLFFFWFVGFLVSLATSMATYLIASNYREKVLAIETANYRANYDVLTGLSNRYHFGQRLKALIMEHQRNQHHFALFFIDLDYFKEVNDNWGHSVGDELLRLFSARMSKIVRSDDLLARLAGDEFVIVLRDLESATQAELLAEKLQLELGEPYLIEGQYLSVTHSLGIAMYPDDGADMESLLQNADRAMYEAKRAGKNRIFFFNEDLSQEVKRHVQVHNEILDGLRRGQFELYLQPIMGLDDNSVQKCEALVRWNHPQRGLVSPGEFIAVAEQTGAIRALGEWILDEACHLATRFEDMGIDIQISVNRSVAEFYPKDVVERWMQILGQHGVARDKIVFEITESLLMEGGDSQLEKIQALRDQGIAFSIDDFGTGYSAINYLRHYPVEYLKIDRSFVTDLLVDEQDRTLVEVIIKMGQTLGIKVIAEGVEDQEQLDVLIAYGCDYGQGYYLGRPEPFDQFVEGLRQRTSA
ncbi:putative bifunctional diguanylate cyclase/phosphodiesterase [Neptuniibacter halophilus]|uniref:putative bifunctional diguanylate cyclase/phosphodiesterase n=1 Tax=Neptuniibacter halophilus TaxID=651666 RepID=UPI002573F2EE|nr:EAL domain-containing protein [Neptuniibacter halophilus]